MIELRENEQKILLSLKRLGGKGNIEKIAEIIDLTHGAVMRTSLALKEKDLITIHEKRHTLAKLSPEGRIHSRQGLPERRLISVLIEMSGKAPVEKVIKKANMNMVFFKIGLGWLHQKGWAQIKGNSLTISPEMNIEGPFPGTDEEILSLLDTEDFIVIEKLSRTQQDAVSILKKRKLIDIDKEILRELKLTEDGRKLIKNGITLVERVSQLTPELIVTGKWRHVNLQRYNIKAPVARTWPGKKHPYLKFLDDLKEKLITFGFKEMTGPIVELMFFNCDSLYMPQDHPAREIHDIYFVKKPIYGNLKQYKTFLSNVKKTHKKGWKTSFKGWDYPFLVRKAKRLILRSQGTALSARTLMSEKLEIPGKYFSISRCYRPDVIDKTHLTEFNQVEGIIVGEALTLRDLFGVLEKFAMDIAGADKMRFRPGYFPFTEPSVELVAYKEGYGWVEFGGAGIFRPEVTLPLNVTVPVLAWGLGVDRLFMIKSGIDDIRYLFTQDLDWLRKKEIIKYANY
jgi:phenylalanyl-tRNA synthetase alpha chain